MMRLPFQKLYGLKSSSKDLVGYGESTWGSFTWGGSVIQRMIYYIRGYGSNMAIELATSSKYNSQHILHDVIVDYTVEEKQQ